MKKSILFTLAAMLPLGMPAPAVAAWDHLGAVQIERGNAMSTYGRFGGRMEALNLTALGATVACRQVAATFGNGRRRVLFSGRLREGEDRTIDLPGDERLVRRIDFDCRPLGDSQATIDIAAEIGNYRGDWQRSPDWANLWSRMFNWASADNTRAYPESRLYRGNDWRLLTTESFEGRFDSETSFTGFSGRNISTLGLRPLDNDARCTRVTATFRNGRTRELDIDGYLPEHRVTPVDLPGDERNIMRVTLACHAVDGNQVTVEVLGRA